MLGIPALAQGGQIGLGIGVEREGFDAAIDYKFLRKLLKPTKYLFVTKGPARF